MNDLKGKLYLVPTPIGNLGDISKRALETIEQADLIACEDTRHSGSLLSKFDLKKKLISYHDFNESARAQQLLDQINQGKNIAVITDAGSPGISDPAYRIVRLAVENEIEIIALPGPTSIIPALTASGLPTDKFTFEGFLPPKSGARVRRFESVAEFEHTLIFFESPHRIEKSLNDAVSVFGDRPACLAREISKKFEEYIRGSLTEIKDQVSSRKIKGELVLVIGGAIKKKGKTD